MLKGITLILCYLAPLLVSLWFLQVEPRDFVRDAIDFRSFYCATRAVTSGQSPYFAEPLRTCEASTSLEVGVKPIRFALPAPLPGYAFVFFSPLSKMPYIPANLTFDLILLIATGFSIVCLIRLTQLPPLMIAAALTISEAFQSLRFGEIVPIVLMLIVMAAFFFEREKRWAAAFALGGAMIEPHVALPAFIGLFLLQKSMRMPLVVVGLALALLSCAFIGTDQSLFYLTKVLPAHAHAELDMNSYQFSLTNLLHYVGVPDRLALALGNASYVGMIACGIALSAALAKRTARPAFFILTPCAIVLLGGMFLHLVQIVCALPFALLLFSTQRAQGDDFSTRRTLIAAIILLAVPWLETSRTGDALTVAITTAIIALIVAWYGIYQVLPIRGAHVRALTCAAMAAILGIAITLTWQQHPHYKLNVPAALAPVKGGRLLAEATWEAYINVVLNTHEIRYVVAKLPTWVGLILLVGSATSIAVSKKRDAWV